MNDVVTLTDRLIEHLAVIYPTHALDEIAVRLLDTMRLDERVEQVERHRNLWDQTDCVLITYGNSITKPGEKPLNTLHQFVNERLRGAVSALHILPFFPHSSDDGFAVIDYLQVDEALGAWEDVTAIAKDYKLMGDLVINHASGHSAWFENYKKRQDPGKDYFCEARPEDDLSAVVRPRNSPLLTEVETVDGVRHVWCTFSADQVDLNFANPEVLIEFAHIIRQYIDRGILWFRMDAVAFLWKEIGGPSIHLPQTHEIIKLLRTLIEHANPDAVVITETNVPNRENLTYFGNANEAHIIYNFSLPPLLLYTLVSGNCRHLKTWMMSMPPAQFGTAYLNFVASHDGIGLRPLDGLLEDREREALLSCMKRFGGEITIRKAREGHDKPYEMNIALYDALQGTIQGGRDPYQLARFVCAHTIMLALEGVPALYIHSILGTENDYELMNQTGSYRSINRHHWALSDLDRALGDDTRHHGKVMNTLRRLLTIRSAQPAFHPNATQFTLHFGTEIFAFWRQSINRSQSIFCINNITRKAKIIKLADINLIVADQWHDLISGRELDDLSGELVLEPYESMWLSNLKDGSA